MDAGLATDRANRALPNVAPGWHTPSVTYPTPAPYPQQQPDNSKKFLNMSGAVLALVIAGVVLLCCVGPIALCFLGGMLDSLQPKPTVTITKCDVRDGGLFRNADIDYTVKNNSGSTRSISITFAVLDASGVKVGDGSAYVTDVAAGQTARGSEMVFLDATGGVTCKVASIS